MQSEMQTALFMIWTLLADSICYDNNNYYTKCVSQSDITIVLSYVTDKFKIIWKWHRNKHIYIGVSIEYVLR